jgi:hypothetical protein
VQNALEADSTSVLNKLGNDRKYVLRGAHKAMFIPFYGPVTFTEIEKYVRVQISVLI